MKKLWDLKKGFSNLELEGEGWGIIMGVITLILLGPFYTIQTKTDQTFWLGVKNSLDAKDLLQIALLPLLADSRGFVDQ